MKWIGSYTIKELLDNCLNSSHAQPPDENGVYLVSKRSWSNKPTKLCDPLYVGTSPDNPKRFKTRMGLLISHMFGLFSPIDTHCSHSGGKSLYEYCKANVINPMELYIGWLDSCGCPACEEINTYNCLKPLLNSPPKKCKCHGTKPIK